MRTTADSVQPTDRVKGLGLVVEFAEPETDYTTRLEGYVVTRSPEGELERFATRVILPNDHVVNVAMTVERFRELQLAGLHAIRMAYVAGPESEVGVGAIETAQALDNLVRRDRHAMPIVDSFEEGGSTVDLVLGFLLNPELDLDEIYEFAALDNPSPKVLTLLP